MKKDVRHFLGCWIAALLVLLLNGCHSSGKDTATAVYIDDLQHHVTIHKPVHRIVSLAPSITESIYAIGADSLLVGVTDYCDFPPQARQKPKVGGMTNPDIERIVSLKPDCVFMSVEGNLRNDYDKLEQTGVPVFAMNPRTTGDVLRSIASLGDICDRSASAGNLNERLRHRQDSIVAYTALSLHKPRIYLFVSLKPLMVAGKNTFVNELIEQSGGTNAGTEGVGSYPIMSRETILKEQPDCMIFTSDIAVEKKTLLKQFPEWINLKAVRENKLYSIDGSIISRPGPRVIDGLEALTRLIHQ